MAYSNANYLINSNRLSTKVHYAPGGASSLSLAWDDGTATKKQKNKVIDTPPFKYKNETPPNVSSQYQPQQQQQQPQYNKNYYQPAYPGFIDLTQSNRILQQQLQYYQNRNKMLRNNLFGGQQNTQLINNYSMRYPQFSQNNQYGSRASENNLSYSQIYDYGYGKSNRKTDELDMAVYQQQKRRQMQKQSNYNGYSYLSYGPQAQEKTSVKVSNPPGGKSSIVFG